MRFKGVWSDPSGDNQMRRIIVKLHGLPPEIQALETYERCYTNKLFVERGGSWSREYSQGSYIPPNARKPDFQDPIGKEIIDSIAAFVFGSDKFPSIAIKVTKDIYPDVDLIQNAINKGELDEEKVKGMKEPEKKRLKIRLCNEEVQRLVSGICTQALLNLPMLEATRYALIMGHSIVVLKIVEGVFYLEVINYKNVRNLEMDPLRPDIIIGFSEMYMFEDDDPANKSRKKLYWNRRDFTDKEEINYHPIPVDEVRGLPEHMSWQKDSKKSVKHDLGYCPAVLFEAPQGRSVFDGQVDNIQSYVYLTNNLMSGVNRDMMPQWAALFDEAGAMNADNFAPKRRGEIVAMNGVKSFTAITPGFQGYDSAMRLRKDLKTDIMKACRINDLGKMNEASGSALTIRLSPTIDAIGEYQICFGDKGLLKLIEMILKTCIHFENIGKDVLVRNDALIPTEEAKKAHFIVQLDFGPVMPVTEEMILAAVTNSLTAYKGGLIDLEHAVRHIAPYFNIVDTEDMVKKIRERMDSLIGGEDAKQMYGRIVHETNQGNKKLLEKGIDTGAQKGLMPGTKETQG